MTDLVRERLEAGDDPSLWETVLGHVLAGVDRTPNMLVEVGRCSHWLCPHQRYWITADGQWFAWPTGYGSGQGGYSYMALPQFDWSVVLIWNGDRWLPATRRRTKLALRVAIPSRTARHQQAAVHTVWRTSKAKQIRWYGFRRDSGAWACTAESGAWKRNKKA